MRKIIKAICISLCACGCALSLWNIFSPHMFALSIATYSCLAAAIIITATYSRVRRKEK